MAVVADLLAGEQVNWTDDFDTVGEARRQHLADIDAVPWLAAEGLQLLALARECADGVVFFVFSTRPYLVWAMAILNENARTRPCCISTRASTKTQT